MVILTGNKKMVFEIKPLAYKFIVNIEPPGLTDNQADLDRLRRCLPESLKDLDFPVEVVRKTSKVCREGNWQVTLTIAAVGSKQWVLDIAPGNAAACCFGVAVDIGTTTIVVQLVDLDNGDIIDTVSGYNSQGQFGEDILTRIYLGSDEKGLLNLQQSVLKTINQLLDRVTAKNEIHKSDILSMVVAGNTTMSHFFLGLSPVNICREPYLPVVNIPGMFRACDIGADINQLAPVYCLPNVGSYVGGDIIAGLLVSEIHKRPDLSLFADIGTNGELVLGNDQWLVTCAGAAGPALEGGAAQFGMRADPGAIYKVEIEPNTHRVDYQVIGGSKPRGICGSGLVDCMAQMLLSGIIDRSGRFKTDFDRLMIAPSSDTDIDEDIFITQNDVLSLLRTKAAVTAAVETLMVSVGCNPDELVNFFAAGAFGAYMDAESAITVGLYPDIPRDHIYTIGNSSLEGARMVLLSRDKLTEGEALAKKMTYFELNNNPEFMKRFSAGLFLPHMDLDRYPSVKIKLQQSRPPA